MKAELRDPGIALRRPRPADGPALHTLVADCPPLDGNSVYCNLLQCTHFAATSVVALDGTGLVGAVTGYLPPGRGDTLFIWQVAVGERARGKGLAGRMLDHIVRRDACAGVRWLETTITGRNAASWALFERFADSREATLERSVMFDRARHFGGAHPTEFLARIGPLPQQATAGSGSPQNRSTA